jgi:hypothetical protein
VPKGTPVSPAYVILNEVKDLGFNLPAAVRRLPLWEEEK